MAKQGSASARNALAFRNVAATVARIYPETLGAARAAVHIAGETTVRLTQAIVPIDTQFMHDHTRAWYSADGLSFEAGWDAAEFADAGLPFYPIFVEFGTRKMAARPSLSRAYADVKPMLQSTVSTLVRAAIERRRAR